MGQSTKFADFAFVSFQNNHEKGALKDRQTPALRNWEDNLNWNGAERVLELTEQSRLELCQDCGKRRS